MSGRHHLAVCVGLGLLLAGCGSAAKTIGTSPTLATTSVVPTPTAAPTLVPTVAPDRAVQACKPLEPLGTAYQLGDLLIGVSLTNISYGLLELPQDAPNAPFRVGTGAPVTTPPINPHQLYLFGVVVCNTSKSASHKIEGVQVRIASVTPLTATPNGWDPCMGGEYTNGQVILGGCGGAYIADDVYQATFDAGASAGASVQTTFVSAMDPATGGAGSPLPRTLAAGQSLVIALNLKPPAAQGTYSFQASVSADGGSQPFLTLPPVIFTTVIRTWTGQACTAAAMRAQIPAGSTNAYVCPPPA